MVPTNPNPSVSDTEDYASHGSSYVSDDDIFNIGDQTPAGSAEDSQISEWPPMPTGSKEWKHEIMMHITEGRDRLNALLPQCEAQKGTIVNDSRKLEEIEEKLQTGDPSNREVATELRINTQVSIVTNWGLFQFLMLICRQFQAAVVSHFTMLEWVGCWDRRLPIIQLTVASDDTLLNQMRNRWIYFFSKYSYIHLHLSMWLFSFLYIVPPYSPLSLLLYSFPFIHFLYQTA